MKEALILIPSYEPDDLLVDTIKSLYDLEFPILLVNDGSPSEFDRVFEQVESYVKYIKHPKNKGKGAALKTGFRKVKELFPDVKHVITVDGDGQHSIKDVLKVYDMLLENDELVFGVRHFDRKIPFRSRFGNIWSKVSRSLLTKQYISDDQCGLRGFPVRYLDELVKIRGNRYEYEMNQIVLFQMKQYKIYTLPIETIYLDNNSRSHFSPFIDTVRIQGRILLHSILAILCNALLIAGMIFMFYKGINTTLTIYSCYTASVLLYYALISIFYPSKVPLRRLFKELLFAAARVSFCYLIILINKDTVNIHYHISIPVAVVSATSVNVLLSWAFKGLFPTFRA